MLRRIAGIALFAVISTLPPAAATPEPIAAGLSEKTGASGRPAAWFRIMQCGGIYLGKIVKMFPAPGENQSNWRCTRCEGEQKGAPVLGLTFIKGIRRQGLAYEGGTVLDPRDGSVYGALMELGADGQQLTVRRYVGIRENVAWSGK
jgi:uncharacterized protein (DUF2147 family)